MNAQLRAVASGTTVASVIEQLYALVGANILNGQRLNVEGSLIVSVLGAQEKAVPVASSPPVPPAGPSPAVTPAAEVPATGAAPSPSADPPKRRGRPPGSKNPQPAVPAVSSPAPAAATPGAGEAATAAPVTPAPVLGPTEQQVLESLHALATTGKGSFQLAEMALSRFGARKRSELLPKFYEEFIALAKKGIETGEV